MNGHPPAWTTHTPRILADLADVHTNLTASRDTSLAAYDPPPAAAAPADMADPNCEISSSGGQMICPPSKKIQFPDKLQPNATQVARCAAVGWPAIDTIGGWRPSDPFPDHPSGQAVDIMMPQGCTQTTGKLAMGKQIVKYLTENAKTFQIVYILWQQQMWTIKQQQWRSVSSNGNCTADHYDHIHVATWKPGGPVLGGIPDPGFKRSASLLRPCPPRLACGVGIGTVQGTPGQIVDAVVSWAASQGTVTGPGEKMSIPAVWRANDSHGSTVSGTRSDHQGPPAYAWAVDIVDPANPNGVSAKKDRMAAALAAAYSIPPTSGSGSAAVWECAARTIGRVRVQLIYRSQCGGNHNNHIHFGVRRTDINPPPVPPRLIYPGRDYRPPQD